MYKDDQTLELPGCRKFQQAGICYHVNLKQTTFFKIQKDRIFEKPYNSEKNICHGTEAE